MNTKTKTVTFLLTLGLISTILGVFTSSLLIIAGAIILWIGIGTLGFADNRENNVGGVLLSGIFFGFL